MELLKGLKRCTESAHLTLYGVVVTLRATGLTIQKLRSAQSEQLCVSYWLKKKSDYFPMQH
jgi:hypothetical protein